MHENQNQHANVSFGEVEAHEGMTSFAPPPLQLMAGSADPPIQRQEDPDAPTTADSDPATPLNEEYLNPLLNANLSRNNLMLIITEWEASLGDAEAANSDYEQLAYILATTYSESFHSWQAGNESLANSDWVSTGEDGNQVDVYGPAGTWGRGFVQTTFASNYGARGDELGMSSDTEGIPDHLNMDLNRGLATLPTISADMAFNRMMYNGVPVQGGGDPLTLDTYFNEEGTGGANRWANARALIGTNHGDGIGDNAQAIYATIMEWAGGPRDQGILLADYLMGNMSLPSDNTKDPARDPFNESRAADAIRVLFALGYLQYETYGIAPGDAQREHYLAEIAGSGDLKEMLYVDTYGEGGALIRFQQDFNAAHNLETPLNEQGILDDPTYSALTSGGHQIASGNANINFAFDGQEQATDLYRQAFDQFLDGEIPASQLGATLLGYMPVGSSLQGAPGAGTTPQDVIAMFDELALGDRLAVMQAMIDGAGEGEGLALIDRPILNYMADTFTGQGQFQRFFRTLFAFLNGTTPDDSPTSGEQTAGALNELATPADYSGNVPLYLFADSEGLWGLSVRLGALLPDDHPDKGDIQLRLAKIREANPGLPEVLRDGQPIVIPAEYAPFISLDQLPGQERFGTGPGGRLNANQSVANNATTR